MATALLMFVLTILSPWSIEKIITSIITTKDGFFVVGIFLTSYISLFFLYRLHLKKHQGWKRIIIVLIAVSGILGGFIAYDSYRLSGGDLGEILLGILAGLLISLAAIEGFLVVFEWVKKGFEKEM
jgi:1,4-dihydroxy-2-naphthoate octaprenyltransferase